MFGLRVIYCPCKSQCSLTSLFAFPTFSTGSWSLFTYVHTHTQTHTHLKVFLHLHVKCLLICMCKTLRKADEAFWRNKTIPFIYSKQHRRTVDIFLRFPMSQCTQTHTIWTAGSVACHVVYCSYCDDCLFFFSHSILV